AIVSPDHDSWLVAAARPTITSATPTIRASVGNSVHKKITAKAMPASSAIALSPPSTLDDLRHSLLRSYDNITAVLREQIDNRRGRCVLSAAMCEWRTWRSRHCYSPPPLLSSRRESSTSRNVSEVASARTRARSDSSA